jgi:hypothetical protein
MDAVLMPITSDVFSRYPNSTLVETGSWHGDGISAALDAGFGRVLSVELSADLYGGLARKYKGDARVQLWHGASEFLLGEMIASLTEPATFWLDAHYSSGDTARGSSITPILFELASIAAHPIKNHTLLIDDVRLFGNEFPVSLDEVYAAIARIGPDYRVSFEDSQAGGHDILVAQRV